MNRLAKISAAAIMVMGIGTVSANAACNNDASTETVLGAGSGALVGGLASNSIGGALGVLASGFWLIELAGLPGTLRIAGLMNLALAAIVAALVFAEPASPPAPAVARPEGSSPIGRVLLIAAFMATSFSAAALGAEGLAADVRMLVGNGYVPGHADLALDLLRGTPAVRALFEGRLAE